MVLVRGMKRRYSLKAKGRVFLTVWLEEFEFLFYNDSRRF